MGRTKIRLDQKMGNVASDHVQFRFAQGAPDKEQRFLNALKDNKKDLDQRYPTMFAWHGSAIHNWHSIIRTGLDFKETVNGRVYGHGVYHAMDQLTSNTYSGLTGSVGVANVKWRVTYTNPWLQGTWAASALKIKSAMSLNEIVNAPKLFTSYKPYIVVQHIDWIQCRYLLVQQTISRSADAAQSADVQRVENADGSPSYVAQDPNFTATSTLGPGRAIEIPLCAVSTSKVFRGDIKSGLLDSSAPLKKKRKQTRDSKSIDDLAASETDDLEDVKFLLSDVEDDQGPNGHSLKTSIP